MNCNRNGNFASLLLALYCLCMWAVSPPANAAGNSAAKIDNSDDDQTDDRAQTSPSEQNTVKQATSLIQQKRYMEAQRVLKQASLADPSSMSIKRTLVYLYLVQNQQKPAIDVAVEMQKLGGMTSPDLVMIGTAYYRAGALTKAESCFKDASQLDTTDSSAEISYIKMMLANKRYSGVIAESDKALARFRTGAASSEIRQLRSRAVAFGQVDTSGGSAEMPGEIHKAPGPAPGG